MTTPERPQRRTTPRSEILANASQDPPPRSEHSAPSRPTLLLIAGIAAAVVIAVVAGVAAGSSFILPVVIFAVLMLVLVAVQRGLALRATQRYGDGAADHAASDADDPVPSIGFDDETELGASPEQTPVSGRR